MAVDPESLTPKAGAGLPIYGSCVPPLLKPQPFNCLGGTVPTIPSYSRTSYESTRIGEHAVMAPGVIPGAILFIGDSLTEQFDVSQVSPFGVNFGISGNRTDSLLDRLASLAVPLSKARAVCLNIGINDINQSVSNSTIQDYMMRLFNWFTGPMVWTKILPTKTLSLNNTADTINTYVAGQLAGRPNFATVDIKSQLINESGVLKPELANDTIHLNEAGNAIWRAALRSALQTV